MAVNILNINNDFYSKEPINNLEDEKYYDPFECDDEADYQRKRRNRDAECSVCEGLGCPICGNMNDFM